MTKSNYFLLSLLFVLLFTTVCHAKSYSLPKAEIYMKINSDASIDVTEKIHFSFSGSYTYAYRDIPKGTWELSNIKVLENGKELETDITDYATYTDIKWYYSANNEKKIFEIKYTLKKAITVYDDVAELYWKVWGDNWAVPLKELYGYIELPKPVEDISQIYVWGHPKLNGKIGLFENNKVLFQIFGIPSKQFAEIRIAIPLSYLEKTDFAIKKSGPGLQKIIDEENSYVAGKKTSYILYIVFLILPVFLFFVLWFFLGREPKVEQTSIYEREVPYDYSPAVVRMLLYQSSNKLTPQDLVGELFDLCLKGNLKLERIKKEKVLGIFGKDDFKIHILNRDASNLCESEKKLLSLIIDAAENRYEGIIFKKKVKDETPNEVTLTELEKFLRSNPYQANKFFVEWKKSVKEEVKRLGLLSGSRKAVWLYVALVAFCLILAFIFFGVAARTILLVYLFEVVILWAIFPNALPNRTEEGAKHYDKWIKLRKFLKDFSSLKDVPPESLVLWEKYLVYAIPLGVTKEVYKAMDFAFKDYTGEQNSRLFVGSYAGLRDVGVSTLANSFSTAFTTSFSSGSGSFGSGGGHGGGGGGGGAG